jgi:hypothetical protein
VSFEFLTEVVMKWAEDGCDVLPQRRLTAIGLHGVIFQNQNYSNLVSLAEILVWCGINYKLVFGIQELFFV